MQLGRRGTGTVSFGAVEVKAHIANQPAVIGATLMRHCRPGYYFASDDMQCTANCGPCTACVAGGTCPGGKEPPMAKPGFFRGGDGQFTECIPAEACPGGRETNCSEGYEGTAENPACSTCSGDSTGMAQYALGALRMRG